jgi:hypothetical protein
MIQIREPKAARLIGFVLFIGGMMLAIYSFPFVTWVAFAFFFLGFGSALGGMLLAIFATRKMR